MLLENVLQIRVINVEPLLELFDWLLFKFNIKNCFQTSNMVVEKKNLIYFIRSYVIQLESFTPLPTINANI